VPEIIDPVFAKTSLKRSFCMTENERFGLVFSKTGSINSGIASVYDYSLVHRVYIFTRDETGLVYLPTQLERTLQLSW
jgi:hypothetical protein